MTEKLQVFAVAIAVVLGWFASLFALGFLTGVMCWIVWNGFRLGFD